MKFEYDKFCRWAFGLNGHYGIVELIKYWTAHELLKMLS